MHGGVLEFSLTWWLHEQQPHVFVLMESVEILKSVQNKAMDFLKIHIGLGSFCAPDFSGSFWVIVERSNQCGAPMIQGRFADGGSVDKYLH